MASASIRNITKPRKASIDVMRVFVAAAVDGCRARGATDVEAIALMMRAFYAQVARPVM
jgi:hypothetical protein